MTGRNKYYTIKTFVFREMHGTTPLISENQVWSISKSLKIFCLLISYIINIIGSIHYCFTLKQFIGRAIDFAKDFQITAENIGLEKALILDYSIKDDDFIGFGLAVLEGKVNFINVKF